MRIEVVWCPAPRQVHQWWLDLPAGATLGQALAAVQAQAAQDPQAPALWGERATAGIWGRRQGPHTVLSEGDRVEVYRDLRVDPKVARRERFNRQGARGTGLFARRRPGAKPGY